RVQREEYARAGRHEVGQLTKKRPFAMNRVKALGLALRQVLQPHGTDRKAGLDDPREDLARKPALDRVGLDDCKSSFVWHLASYRLSHPGSHIRRPLHDVDAGIRQRLHLFRRGTLTASDDRARVSHPASWRSSLPGDKPDHWLIECAPDERRG